MRVMFYILMLGLVTNLALATEFNTTSIYCNGPVTSGNVSNCPSFSSWKGVSLKDLKSINLPIKATDSQIRLEDTAGNIWEQQVATCQSRLSDLRGCNIQVDLSNPEQISIRISIWGIGQHQRNLALFLDKHRGLSLLPDEGDNLMFILTEK
jgi:hypothetical protein